MKEEISLINGSIYTWLNIESIIENLNELEESISYWEICIRIDNTITSDVTDSFYFVIKREGIV